MIGGFMKKHFSFLFLLGAFCFCGTLRSGETILLQDPLTAQKEWRTEKGISFGSEGLRVVVTNESEQSKLASKAMANRDLLGNMAQTTDRAVLASREFHVLQKYRNYMLEISVEAKAFSVTVPKVPWEGVRFVMNYDTECLWYSECCNGYSGSFDWRILKFRTRVPIDLKKATLSLGIIGNRGEILFRNLKIAVVEGPLPAPNPNARPPANGHSLGRLRGLNTGSGLISKERVARKHFAEWKNCNLYKFTVNAPVGDISDKEFDAFCDYSIRQFDRFLYFLKKHSRALGVLQFCGFRDKVGRTETHASALEKKTHDRNILFWDKVAAHFKGEKAIWAFELYNEMEIRIEPKFDYNKLMETIAKRINAIDPDRWMIVQQEAWWGQRSMDRLRPIRAKNIIYGIHHYTPFPFSHQRLGSQKKVVTYPSVIEGLKWDKEMIRRDLAPARHFQQAYNVPIFVSEFCCVSWAEDGGRWTRDCIELFEEYGWDWMWHCIAEFQAWDPYKDAKLKTVAETGRSKALNDYFAKNKFPPKFEAVRPPQEKYGRILCDKPEIRQLNNYKEWNSIPLFSGGFRNNGQVTLKMRILCSNKGFGSIRLAGENDSCAVLIRPRGVSYLMNGKQEIGFQNGGVTVPERNWGQYDLIFANGKLKVAANGIPCGEIPFVPEEITSISVSGASTDLEIKDVVIRNLGKEGGTFAPAGTMEQTGKDILLYQSPENKTISLKNLNAWKSVPIYSGDTGEALTLSMECRILNEKKGFAIVDIFGTNGSFKLVRRPNSVNFTCTQKSPALNRLESGFPKSDRKTKPGEWETLEFSLTGKELSLLTDGNECGSIDFLPGRISKIILSAAYADCEFRNINLRYSNSEKVLRDFQAAAKDGTNLYHDPAGMVHKLENRNAWNSIPVFKGTLEQGFRLRFEYRILSEKNGFVHVNLTGEKGRQMTIFRPGGVSSAAFMKEKSASRNETVLPSGSIPFVAGQWQTAELVRRGNRSSVTCNGKSAGSINCDVGKFRDLIISATSADCEIRAVSLCRLP